MATVGERSPERGVALYTWGSTSEAGGYSVHGAKLDAAACRTVDCGAVQAAVPTVDVAWESTMPFNVMKKFDLALTKNCVYYAMVRAVNRAELWSAIEVSDGVTVGKNEVKPDPAKPINVGFAALSARDIYTLSPIHY